MLFYFVLCSRARGLDHRPRLPQLGGRRGTPRCLPGPWPPECSLFQRGIIDSKGNSLNPKGHFLLRKDILFPKGN